MELQTFIKETLVQIANGLIEAQNELKEKDFYINPMAFNDKDLAKSGYENKFRKFQTIKIKTLVTVNDDTTKEAGAGAKLSIFKAGVGIEESKSNSSATELEFEVPVSFPVSEIK